jgi:hypothetical protein
MAVSKAIKSGRLKASIVRDHLGKPKIADPELADREWASGTDLSRAPGYVKERASARARGRPEASTATTPPPRAPPPPPGDRELAGEPLDLNLGEETAREKFWKANLAELDFRKRSGELVEAKELEGKLVDLFAGCKNKLLGVPSRARQQDPALTPAQLALVDALIREALEDLAAEGEAAEAEAQDARADR